MQTNHCDTFNAANLEMTVASSCASFSGDVGSFASSSCTEFSLPSSDALDSLNEEFELLVLYRSHFSTRIVLPSSNLFFH